MRPEPLLLCAALLLAGSSPSGGASLKVVVQDVTTVTRLTGINITNEPGAVQLSMVTPGAEITQTDAWLPREGATLPYALNSVYLIPDRGSANGKEFTADCARAGMLMQARPSRYRIELYILLGPTSLANVGEGSPWAEHALTVHLKEGSFVQCALVRLE